MAKKNKKKNQPTVKQVIRAAGPVISKTEMNKIVKAAGGSTKVAVNRIASVQKNAKASSQPAPSVGSAAANMLIKQASSTPTITGTSQFGDSKLGQTLQGMTATPAYTAPRNPQGGTYGTSTPGTDAQLVPGGMMIKPGGNFGVAPQQTGFGVPTEGPVAGKPPGAPTTTEPTTEPTTTSTEPVNPLQDAIDAILGELEPALTTQAKQNQYFQDIANQTQMQAQQQMAEMSNMFNQQLLGAQDMYNMQIQQANAQTLADQEAARAFMINQGRAVMPANLQIGATYGTPQLAGTQGFKANYRRPSLTPAQVSTAFTAPTLAAALAPTPTMTQQPIVLNV